MNTHEQLITMLDDLSKMISGKWFVGDGALLGITRDKKLIEWDDDIDIYLLPDSYITIPDKSFYEIDKYYMNDKFYNSLNPRAKLNSWTQYCSYKRTLPENKGLNRAELAKKVCSTYRSEARNHRFSTPNIDIFYLKYNEETDEYIIPYWENVITYSYEELDELEFNTDLGISIPVPNPTHAKNILTRQYGKDWWVPNPKFKYF